MRALPIHKIILKRKRFTFIFLITKTEAELFSLQCKVSHSELGKQDEGRLESEDDSYIEISCSPTICDNLWEVILV